MLPGEYNETRVLIYFHLAENFAEIAKNIAALHITDNLYQDTAQITQAHCVRHVGIKI